MPTLSWTRWNILGADEAIYVIDGVVTIESDGQTREAEIGSFSYAAAGTILRWRITTGARLLVFHFPGGFESELAGAQREDALIVAWLESFGTRFLEPMGLEKVKRNTGANVTPER